ncbi:MAG TPA: hypothetical protein DEP05_04365, partial [Betaproteobacteria bacterium]|nr:hypothetical protein [Betaproteobacteria bacterium]
MFASARQHACMRKMFPTLLWALPFILQSSDACAWGLLSHVYYAQLLIWAIPLADPRFSRAVKRFSHLVMAGACLPDLAIVGKGAGTKAFDANHRWETAAGLLANAGSSDEALALALGYSSHLLVDVIAHHYFVPAHEQLWVNAPHVTHAVCEWAMDAHIAPHVFSTPGELLLGNAELLAAYVAAYWPCTHRTAARAVLTLGKADNLLRGSGLPVFLYRAANRLDSRVRRRFNHYAVQTSERLPQINRLLAGDFPA